MTIEAYAAADHVVDAGHVRVMPDGRGASLVDSILAARGLRRRIAVILPSSSAVPHVVAATDLIATLPSKIVSDLHIPGLSVIPAPLPPVEVSAHLFLASAGPELAPARSDQGDRGGPLVQQKANLVPFHGAPSND
jgi:DNA-binding transcriptional LysR family regulator